MSPARDDLIALERDERRRRVRQDGARGLRRAFVDGGDVGRRDDAGAHHVALAVDPRAQLRVDLREQERGDEREDRKADGEQGRRAKPVAQAHEPLHGGAAGFGEAVGKLGAATATHLLEKLLGMMRDAFGVRGVLSRGCAGACPSLVRSRARIAPAISASGEGCARRCGNGDARRRPCAVCATSSRAFRRHGSALLKTTRRGCREVEPTRIFHDSTYAPSARSTRQRGGGGVAVRISSSVARKAAIRSGGRSRMKPTVSLRITSCS